MNLLRWILLSAGMLAWPWCGLHAADTNDAASFQEVYDLLRANLVGADEAALNRAAVKGMISQLSPRVTLVGDALATTSDPNTVPLPSTALFDGAYGYLRVGQIVAGLDKNIAEAFRKMTATNKLKGLVIDLRFAHGQDYAAAAAAADLFIARELPLIDWGQGVTSSKEKSDAIALPVAVLVNQKTSEAAEALAGILRQADVGLVLGATTAGRATMSKEFTLKNGQRLRVATTPIKVGKEHIMSLAGLKPDIQIEVSPDDEKAFYNDAFKVLPKAIKVVAATGSSTNGVGTNRPSRRRINEAELVRMSREGQSPDSDFTDAPPPRNAEPAKPVVNDPALARAIDLLKGLAVVQQFRSI